MVYEVEVKYPLPEPDRFRALLIDRGAHVLGVTTQRDDYLAHPQRDFSATDEAFRIRRTSDANRLTYKGPLVDRQTKTREEIEIGFEAGPNAADKLQVLLDRLGFPIVFSVSKQRELFTLTHHDREFEVVIDCVDGLGWFVELEAAATAEERTNVQTHILELAHELGLGPTVERRSYLRLLLAQQADEPG